MVNEQGVVLAARILDSQRSTVVELLKGHGVRLQRSVERLREEMADESTMRHAETAEVAQHAAMMGRYIGRLVELNSGMAKLRRLANELDAAWPDDLCETAVVPRVCNQEKIT